MADIQDRPTTIPNPHACAGIFAAAAEWLRPPAGSELASLPDDRRRAMLYADAMRDREARDA